MNVTTEQKIDITLSVDEAADLFYDLGHVKNRSECSEKLMNEIEPELHNNELCTDRKFA